MKEEHRCNIPCCYRKATHRYTDYDLCSFHHRMAKDEVPELLTKDAIL